jgi:hypothetical protein
LTVAADSIRHAQIQGKTDNSDPIHSKLCLKLRLYKLYPTFLKRLSDIPEIALAPFIHEWCRDLSCGNGSLPVSGNQAVGWRGLKTPAQVLFYIHPPFFSCPAFLPPRIGIGGRVPPLLVLRKTT